MYLVHSTYDSKNVYFLYTRTKVQALCYAAHAKKLISCSEDGAVMAWDMNVKRQEVNAIFIMIQYIKKNSFCSNSSCTDE